MQWREVSFVVARDEVEPWSDGLLEAGAVSVMAEDADADSPDEQALYGEPGMPPPASGWERTRLSLLLAASEDYLDLLRETAEQLDESAPGDLVVRVFADEDWVRRSQSQFEPIEVQGPQGRTLLIQPSWRVDDPAEPSQDASHAARLILDPGLAFGTGSHPTTSLCLRWLLGHDVAGQRVIDYGCGSGILALAACKLGAAEVIGIDIDPQALIATQRNAATNAVDVHVMGSEDAAPEPADLVLANILSSPLKVLAPLLQSLVKPGGYLVLSGLLERQIEEIVAHYPQIALQAVGIHEGWACLAGRKSG